MQSKSAELQEQISNLDLAIQQGSTDAQLNLWEMQRKELQDQLQVVLAEEAQQQERIDAQEAEIESIELPLDFNELLSDGEFKITKANDMIIEVVREDRRAQNVIHNGEIAALREEWNGIIKSIGTSAQEMTNELQEKVTDLEARILADNEQATLDRVELNRLELLVPQMMLEKQQVEQSKESLIREAQEKDRLYNGACEKRNNVIRLLDEANVTIEKLKADIERLQSSKSTGTVGTSISQTNRLAELQAEANREKAARGIERFNKQYGTDIPTIEVPEVQPVNAVLETVEAAAMQPFPVQVQATDDTGIQSDVRDAAENAMVGPNEESEVNDSYVPYKLHSVELVEVTKAEFDVLKNEVESLKSRLTEIESHIPSAA